MAVDLSLASVVIYSFSLTKLRASPDHRLKSSEEARLSSWLYLRYVPSAINHGTMCILLETYEWPSVVYAYSLSLKLSARYVLVNVSAMYEKVKPGVSVMVLDIFLNISWSNTSALSPNGRVFSPSTLHTYKLPQCLLHVLTAIERLHRAAFICKECINALYARLVPVAV